MSVYPIFHLVCSPCKQQEAKGLKEACYFSSHQLMKNLHLRNSLKQNGNEKKNKHPYPTSEDRIGEDLEFPITVGVH